ncbi:MAG: kelch repeat-containing protein, partial [Bacteroidota bacterium]
LLIQKRRSPHFIMTGFALNGKGYLLTNAGNNFYEYNPSTNTWNQKKDFAGRSTFGDPSFTIGNKGYIASSRNKELWQYDPLTDTWNQKANFIGSAVGVGFVLDGKGYVGTGWSQSDRKYHTDFWAYDPANDIWKKTSSFPGAGRSGAFSFVIGSNAYVGGGRGPAFTEYNDVWEFTP